MSKPLWFREKITLELKKKLKTVRLINRKHVLFSLMILALVPGSVIGIFGQQSQRFALAYSASPVVVIKTNSPLLENENNLFVQAEIKKIELTEKAVKIEAKKIEPEKKVKKENLEKRPVTQVSDEKKEINSPILKDDQNNSSIVEAQTKIPGLKLAKSSEAENEEALKFAEKLYGIVGESPIKEMVPFISERDEKVAAFLVGIAKKESSFGSRSPLKDGKTCYNYWGYKGSAGRGTGMGYACFASAEEAIQVVGDRIETLVEKDRNTPARMVDTWKCGRSCAGDPGAPGWVSTVAMYFNQIVDSKNS